MAYIPYTPFVPEKDASASVVIPVSSSVTALSQQGAQGSYTLNLDLFENSLKTRSAVQKKCQISEIWATFYSITKEPFCDKIVLHIGSGLYTYSKNDAALTKLDFEFPDKQSVFVYFMSCLYIYCDYRVFKLNDSFEIEECKPYIPTIFKHLSPTIPDLSDREDVPINLISPIIKVDYSETTVRKFRLPYDADLSKEVLVYNNGSKMRLSQYELEEDHFILSSTLVSDKNNLEIVYYVKNPADIGFDDTLYRCSITETFGGAVGGGTRIFFTGDAQKRGYYYKSELQDPLFIPSDGYEIIGDGCENVTGLIKMYGRMVMLTDKGVYQMVYSLSESGPLFSVKQLTNAQGCDMPGSVQLIDNRVVFANTRAGVFIVDSVEDNGEHNVKPLSYNILEGEGLGLLDNQKSNLISASSCDFDRKYYLFVGQRAYIWDYDNSPYSESGSYAKSQKRLNWYIYDGLARGIAHNLEEDFVIFSPEELAIYGFDEESDNVSFGYKSQKVDFGRADTKKYVTKLTLVLSAEQHNSISLWALCDGEEYYTRSIDVCDKKKSISVVLPKKQMFDFSYRLEGEGSICLHSAKAQYMYLTK